MSENNRTEPGNVAPLTVGEGVTPLTVGNFGDIRVSSINPNRMAELDEMFLDCGKMCPETVTVRSGDQLEEFTFAQVFGAAAFPPIMRVISGISLFMAVKNYKYGNSAIEPKRIFSKASAEEQLLVRLDDKISRIQQRQEPGLAKNDAVDLLGYLILYCVMRGWFSFRDLLD